MSFLHYKNQINPPSDTAYENCLGIYVSEVQALKEENIKLKKQFDEIVPPLQKRIDALEKLNQSLNYQIQILETGDDYTNNANSDICDALSRKFQSKDEEIDILKAKNKELKKQNRIISSKLSKYRSNEQANVEKTRELENKINYLEEINEAMKIRIANYEESLQLKTTSLLEDEIAKLKKINSQLSKKLKKFQTNFSQPAIHQQNIQRKAKLPTTADNSPRGNSPSQNKNSSKKKSYQSSHIYNNQNDSFFNDIYFSSDSGSSYNTHSDSDFNISNDANVNNSYTKKTRKVPKSSLHNTSTSRPIRESPESELSKIANMLQQNYSNFSPSQKISDQFREFIDQISAIASKE
ncbi:hypothetical protein M9Y10_009408 [Tritrichomonas musculus]|uniref:Uncharacterized protein n=1 Tax=Tritrichomonas musculus TaxID=1915356 RepID=A0ABR2IPH0_9EUKA